MKDQEKWCLAAGMATEHIDRCGYEYLNEKHFSVVVCSLEHGLDPAKQCLCLCCPIYGIDFIFLLYHCWNIDLCVLQSAVQGQRKLLHKPQLNSWKWIQAQNGRKGVEGKKEKGGGSEHILLSSSTGTGGGQSWKYTVSKFPLLIQKINVSGFYIIKQ